MQKIKSSWDFKNDKFKWEKEYELKINGNWMSAKLNNSTIIK